MRDISHKSSSLRTAVAQALLKTSPSTIALIRKGEIPKGDPFPVAKVAAVQAAKNASQTIPYCHPIPLDYVDCRFEIKESAILVETEVKAVYKTGVEMEALMAASVAVLTIYDMLKMLDDTMEIGRITLVRKTGGKADFKKEGGKKRKAAVLVLSDSISASGKGDLSGKLIEEKLTSEGFDVIEYKVIPDDEEAIRKALTQLTDTKGPDLIITTGGTGLGPRDVTPEATASVLEREASGIAEIVRSYGQERTPFSMLSRGTAGVRGKTLIINLPGSPNGVQDSLNALFPALHHSFRMMDGERHSTDSSSSSSR